MVYLGKLVYFYSFSHLLLSLFKKHFNLKVPTFFHARNLDFVVRLLLCKKLVLIACIYLMEIKGQLNLNKKSAIYFERDCRQYTCYDLLDFISAVGTRH